MNTDFSLFKDTAFNDEDLYNAVVAILTNAAQSAAAEPTAGLQTLESITISSAAGRYVPHILQQQQKSNTKKENHQ